MPHLLIDQSSQVGKRLALVGWTSLLCTFSSAALSQNNTAYTYSSVSATVIAPIVMTTSLTSLRFSLSTHGAWFQMLIPATNLGTLVSSLSMGCEGNNASVASLLREGEPMTIDTLNQFVTCQGTVQGNTVSAFSLRARKGNAPYGVTVAFN